MERVLSVQEITPGKEVDLGLPSGTIWAAWNVGATSPEQYGDGTSLNYFGYLCRHWSATLREDGIYDYAYFLDYDSSLYYSYYCYTRYSGLSVRPVK